VDGSDRSVIRPVFSRLVSDADCPGRVMVVLGGLINWFTLPCKDDIQSQPIAHPTKYYGKSGQLNVVPSGCRPVTPIIC
jgi:hypothetical protein